MVELGDGYRDWSETHAAVGAGQSPHYGISEVAQEKFRLVDLEAEKVRVGNVVGVGVGDLRPGNDHVTQRSAGYPSIINDETGLAADGHPCGNQHTESKEHDAEIAT